MRSSKGKLNVLIATGVLIVGALLAAVVSSAGRKNEALELLQRPRRRGDVPHHGWSADMGEKKGGVADLELAQHDPVIAQRGYAKTAAVPDAAPFLSGKDWPGRETRRQPSSAR